MGAAQQKLLEIDRLERETDLTGRVRPAAPAFDANSLNEQENENKTARSLQLANLRTPLISASPEIPTDKNFVGSRHAGDGVLGASPASVQFAVSPPVATSDYTSITAASANSGPDSSKSDKYQKSERLVGTTGVRQLPPNVFDTSIQASVARELARIGTTGVAQYSAPHRAAERRAIAFKDLVQGLWLPIVAGLITLIIAIFLIISVANFLGQNKAVPSATATIAAVTTAPVETPTIAAATPMVVAQPLNIKVSGVDASKYNLYIGKQTDGLANLMQVNPDSSGNFALSSAATQNLEQGQKYQVLLRPKDTPTRKYQPDLPLDSPLQAPYVQNNLPIVPGNDLELNFKLPAQSLEFYPFDGGNKDADAEGGGRYYGTTHHIVRPAFLDYYDQQGVFNRLGFPLSEEFDWPNVGHVQFFERGWLVKGSDGTVIFGATGQQFLAANCPASVSAFVPPASALSTKAKLSTDAAFSSYLAKNNWLGKPLTNSFTAQAGNVKKLVQYFEHGRLELSQNDKNAAIELGLVGSEFARCQGWS